jgi:hypothetical protein
MHTLSAGWSADADVIEDVRKDLQCGGVECQGVAHCTANSKFTITLASNRQGLLSPEQGP